MSAASTPHQRNQVLYTFTHLFSRFETPSNLRLPAFVRRRKMKILGRQKRRLQTVVSEIIGCTFLMCFGCLGTLTRSDSHEKLPLLQSSMLCCFLVCSISLAIGYISGTHLNPCVTLCALLLGRMKLPVALLYLTADLVGMMMGLGVAILLIPPNLYSIYVLDARCGFCATVIHPDIHLMQAFAMEFLGTFFLILCVCGASDKRAKKLKAANAIKFGLLIGMMSFSIGPFTGASLNPLRSLAPAVYSNCWQNQWLYWAAPLSGSTVATFLYKYVLKQPDLPEIKPSSTPIQFGVVGRNPTQPATLLASESRQPSVPIRPVQLIGMT